MTLATAAAASAALSLVFSRAFMWPASACGVAGAIPRRCKDEGDVLMAERGDGAGGFIIIALARCELEGGGEVGIFLLLTLDLDGGDGERDLETDS